MARQCSLKHVEIDVSLPRPPVVVALVALASSAACHGRASPQDCERMIDHYLDLAVRESSAGAVLTAPQASAVRDVERGLKRAEPTYRRVQDRCATVDGSERRCALAAETTSAWEACLHGSPPATAKP